MNPVDVGHRVFIVGLVGLSAYYGAFVSSTMGAMVRLAAGRARRPAAEVSTHDIASIPHAIHTLTLSCLNRSRFSPNPKIHHTGTLTRMCIRLLVPACLTPLGSDASPSWSALKGTLYPHHYSSQCPQMTHHYNRKKGSSQPDISDSSSSS